MRVWYKDNDCLAEVLVLLETLLRQLPGWLAVCSPSSFGEQALGSASVVIAWSSTCRVAAFDP